MRNVPLACVFVFAFGLAACDSPSPPKSAPVEPVKPVVQAAPVTPPPPAPSADEALLERVKRALRDTRKVDAQGVGVTVADGVVSLFGTAPSDAERRGIEQFVAGIDGVKSVVSKLVVVRGS